MSPRRRRGLAGAALLAGALLACGGSDDAATPTASTSSAIQAGTVDTTHQFAVGVAQMGPAGLSVCSGVLLAPNLVATARHCVTTLSSLKFDCATSTFAAPLPPAQLYVTTDGRMTANSVFTTVSKVVVPSGAGQDRICGNDLALLVLTHGIQLAQYVEPIIDPPMTDPATSTSVAAIGYGLDTPTDEAGTSAGVRRIKENVGLFCVPGATRVPDCFTNPLWAKAITASEFVSGDASTCEGDSGSGAFDQASFSAGKWVSFGVLSRGSVSPDGQTCVQPIYERFDAWGPLLADTAKQAAAAGGYAMPSWASAPPAPRDAGSSAPPTPAPGSGAGGSLPGPVGVAAPADAGGCAACAANDSGAAPSVALSGPVSVGCAVAMLDRSGSLDDRRRLWAAAALLGLAFARRRR